MPVNVKYTRLTTPADAAPSPAPKPKPKPTASDEYIVLERTSVYDVKCIPVCKVVNYDSLPGTCLGKGCFGFVGSCVPVIAGLIGAGLGMAATAAAMALVPSADPDNTEEKAFVLGSIASVALGTVASALACYRSSLCCDGPDIIKHKVDVEKGKQIVLKDI